jgi:hypothetical protein
MSFPISRFGGQVAVVCKTACYTGLFFVCQEGL